MDVLSTSYPGNILPTEQGRPQNPCEIVSSAAYYVLGKVRLIDLNEEMMDSKVTQQDEDFSLTCELWESPVGKSIYMRKCAFGEENKKYLRDEKMILRAAQGPNIVKLIETEDDSLLMPHAGKTLYYMLEKRGEGFTPEEFKSYALQMMNGVAHLHDLRIWHLDLKPANLLVDDDNNLSIIDFGLAQFVGPAEQKEVCTEGYKSPEMFYRGPREVSKKTDVFSAGVILFEMLTNERLFPEGFEQETMTKQHLYYEYLNHRLKEVESIDKHYATLLKSMLAWNPKHRPTAQHALNYLRWAAS